MATRAAAKKAEERRISQIGDFKSRLGGITELPSSLVVKLRNPGGLKAFMSAGTIPNSLMTIIEKNVGKGKAPKPEELMPDGKMDPVMLVEMTAFLDVVALKCIVEPRFLPVPSEADLEKWNLAHPDEQLDDAEDLRSDDELYIDELPEDDKTFIFQWVSGGTRDLEEFRRKLDANVDAVAAVAVIGSNA